MEGKRRQIDTSTQNYPFVSHTVNKVAQNQREKCSASALFHSSRTWRVKTANLEVRGENTLFMQCTVLCILLLWEKYRGEKLRRIHKGIMCLWAIKKKCLLSDIRIRKIKVRDRFLSSLRRLVSYISMEKGFLKYIQHIAKD